MRGRGRPPITTHSATEMRVAHLPSPKAMAWQAVCALGCCISMAWCDVTRVTAWRAGSGRSPRPTGWFASPLPATTSVDCTADATRYALQSHIPESPHAPRSAPTGPSDQ